jgi:hypothetical protein
MIVFLTHTNRLLFVIKTQCVTVSNFYLCLHELQIEGVKQGCNCSVFWDVWPWISAGIH